MSMSQGERMRRLQEESKVYVARNHFRDSSEYTLIKQNKSSLYLQPEHRTPTAISNPIPCCGDSESGFTLNTTIERATFFFQGDNDQTWTVPANTSKVVAYIWGAGGRGQNAGIGGVGGSGAFASAQLNVSPGDVLHIIVGSGQYPVTTTLYGGGASVGGANSSGGGFSGIFNDSPSQESALLIAGGGGGGGYGGGGYGGGGGYPNGLNGIDTSSIGFGYGGTQNAGGNGCVNGSPLAGGGGDGGCGGGGAGGFYGGGSGISVEGGGSGGGGGSSYVFPSITNYSFINGVSGNLSTNPTPAVNTSSPYYQAGTGGEGQNGAVVIYYEITIKTIKNQLVYNSVASGTTTFNSRDAVANKNAGKALCCEPDYSLTNSRVINIREGCCIPFVEQLEEPPFPFPQFIRDSYFWDDSYGQPSNRYEVFDALIGPVDTKVSTSYYVDKVISRQRGFAYILRSGNNAVIVFVDGTGHIVGKANIQNIDSYVYDNTSLNPQFTFFYITQAGNAGYATYNFVTGKFKQEEFYTGGNAYGLSRMQGTAYHNFAVVYFDNTPYDTANFYALDNNQTLTTIFTGGTNSFSRFNYSLDCTLFIKANIDNSQYEMMYFYNGADGTTKSYDLSNLPDGYPTNIEAGFHNSNFPYSFIADIPTGKLHYFDWLFNSIYDDTVDLAGVFGQTIDTIWSDICNQDLYYYYTNRTPNNMALLEIVLNTGEYAYYNITGNNPIVTVPSSATNSYHYCHTNVISVIYANGGVWSLVSSDLNGNVSGPSVITNYNESDLGSGYDVYDVYDSGYEFIFFQNPSIPAPPPDITGRDVVLIVQPDLTSTVYPLWGTISEFVYDATGAAYMTDNYGRSYVFNSTTEVLNDLADFNIFVPALRWSALYPQNEYVFGTFYDEDADVYYAILFEHGYPVPYGGDLPFAPNLTFSSYLYQNNWGYYWVNQDTDASGVSIFIDTDINGGIVLYNDPTEISLVYIPETSFSTEQMLHFQYMDNNDNNRIVHYIYDLPINRWRKVVANTSDNRNNAYDIATTYLPSMLVYFTL